MKTENKYMKMEDHVSLNLGNQGALFLVVLAVFFGYFGLICNTLLREINEGLIWHFTIYFKVFYGLPILILFATFVLFAYIQDIYHYAIKHAFWIVNLILIISIAWYWILYGVSSYPLILLFARWQGYVNTLLLYIICISGAIFGGKFRRFIEIQKSKKYYGNNSTEIGQDNKGGITL